MEEKIIESGPSVIKKFLNGVNEVDAVVGSTLGPAGRNVIIGRKYRSPMVTNDGVTAARHMVLKDEMEDLAAQVLVEVAMKTNDTAGDGTTTSVVIGAMLTRFCLEKIIKEGGDKESAAYGISGANPMQLSRDIQAEVKKALELLDKQKEDFTEADMANVIATSLENLEFGETLAKLLTEVGQDGYVATEENWGTKYGIEVELTKGMRFFGTYASPYLATDRNRKEAVWEDTLVLVTNEKIETATVLTSLIKQLQAAGKRKLVIIGGHSENVSPYSKNFIAGLTRLMEAAAAGNQNVIEILAIKCPSLTSEELEDVAVFCDAKFFDKNMGMRLLDIEPVHLGFAKKIVVGEDDVNILDGRGNPAERIELLKNQQDIEKDPMFEEKRKRRIASLAAAIGVIRVGASTEQERTYLKYKIEDAVNAAKAAREEGIVRGGGLALKAVAEVLGKGSILYAALMAPYDRIQSNAGGDLTIPDTVVDPHKVVRLALTNGVSAASMLITCSSGISDRKQTLWDSFEKRLGQTKLDDDFRSDGNLDQGRGRLS